MGGSLLNRPNLPVAPYGATSSTISFIDPTVKVHNGQHASIGQKSLIGPFATIDARGGTIQIGDGSAILDNSTLVDAPGGGVKPGSILIGNNVEIGFGATVEGQSTIGLSKSSTSTTPTSIGPNALIDNATIQSGAIVSALARVGPGVTVPTGYVVLPGANVTTNAQASDPSLGMVRKITTADQTLVTQQLAHDSLLAAGYASLVDGDSTTGTTGVGMTKGVYLQDQTTITGIGLEPGSANGVTFEPSKSTSPQFQSPTQDLAPGTLYTFPARITGRAFFSARPQAVKHKLGQKNAIRADDGQPISFASAPSTGNAVTINSPAGSTTTTSSGGITTQVTGGAINIGSGIQVAGRVVILGGPNPTATVTTTVTTTPVSTATTTVTTTSNGSVTTTTKDSTTPTTTTTTTNSITQVAAPSDTIGNNVTIGKEAVVDRSSIGNGASIGARSLIQGSTVAAGAVIPAGTILVNNKVVGTVEW